MAPIQMLNLSKVREPRVSLALWYSVKTRRQGSVTLHSIQKRRSRCFHGFFSVRDTPCCIYHSERSFLETTSFESKAHGASMTNSTLKLISQPQSTANLIDIDTLCTDETMSLTSWSSSSSSSFMFPILGSRSPISHFYANDALPCRRLKSLLLASKF